MCWIDLEDVLSFSRASSWAYSVAIDDSVWCWHCAKRLNLQVLPQLMKRITKTDYRRLWMLLNNALSLSIVRDRYEEESANEGEFIIELKVGALKETRRSVFPRYMFAPERAKE